LTAFENAQLPFWHINSRDRKKHEVHLHETFESLGLSELRDRFPKQLSGGQEQRVAVARALANFPKLILADEPTGNLDSHTAKELMQLLKRRCEELKATLLVVTHDSSMLSHFDKVVFFRDGKITKTES
jgi:putative ABC transport system ATP-binding protein